MILNTSNPNIVIAKAPLRISFVGGGSDLPPGKGATISTAIDKFVYVAAKWRNDSKVIMNWREREEVACASDLNHDLARESLLMLGVNNGIEITTFADVPGVGSGLGSSAATTVAIIQAVAGLTGIWLDAQMLAKSAVNVELKRLFRTGGSQDQWISALGGICRVSHNDGDCISFSKIELSSVSQSLLGRHFALFSPPEDHIGRDSNSVLKTMTDGGSHDFRYSCHKLVGEFSQSLSIGDFESCGDLVANHDKLKRSTFSNYFPAAGAALDELGIKWKICGAGYTGHLLVAVTPESREVVIDSVEQVWGKELPWKVCQSGSEVIYAS